MSNKRVRRKTMAEHRNKVQYPKNMTPVDVRDLPSDAIPEQYTPDYVWVSRYFMAQLYFRPTPEYPSLMRLSIHRMKRKRSGEWGDGITWDELMQVKRDVGFGDWYAIEVYPPDAEIVNVSNIRHLWILEQPLNISFKKES